MSEVTRILASVEQGDLHAAAQLLPLVYDELRQLAAQRLAQEKPGQTLDATALVHEAYLRLVGPADPNRWRDRGHFFAACAEAMRRILVDHARRRQELAEVELTAAEPGLDLLALNDALVKLESRAPRKAELVKLRCFAGLTIRGGRPGPRRGHVHGRQGLGVRPLLTLRGDGGAPPRRPAPTVRGNIPPPDRWIRGCFSHSKVAAASRQGIPAAGRTAEVSRGHAT
jgi:RNA polymerase sigma factor (TIGR02999 family)